MGATVSTVATVAAVTAVASALSGNSGAASYSIPMSNPLSSYGSYDYIFSLSCLDMESYNVPSQSYLAGKMPPLILKSAGIDYSNRFTIGGTQMEFYMTDLELESAIGFKKGQGNTTTVEGSFTVVEPYSMGEFFTAVQAAAYLQSYENYNTAYYLLTIEFRGNTDTGTMQNLPTLTKYIPIRITGIDMKVTASGSTYHCTFACASVDAIRDNHRFTKVPSKLSGKTVQEVLQTGTNSLQAVVNQKNLEIAKKFNMSIPDQIVILFPKDMANSSVKVSGTSNGALASNSNLQKALGVSATNTTSVVAQDSSNVNAMGQAKVGYNPQRGGNRPYPKEVLLWDDKAGWNQAGVTYDPATAVFQFPTNSDIIHIINTVLQTSDYAQTALQNDPDQYGNRKWWKIDTQVFLLNDDSNSTSTGNVPQVVVFRVIPYDAHASRMTAPNVGPPGIDLLKNQIAKVYDYIYTGQNSEVIDFEVKIENTFVNMFHADGYSRTQDRVTQQRNAQADTPKADNKNSNVVVPTNGQVAKPPGQEIPQQTKTSAWGTGSLHGNVGELEITKVAQQFHNALEEVKDLVNLDLKIVGDPYYLSNSGVGNYTAAADSLNVTVDGDMAYQNGEVHIAVYFRNPSDINSSTGLYDFQKNKLTAMFSGVFRVFTVTSSFKDGMFTQILHATRIPNQNNTPASSGKGSLTTTNVGK